jgi:peptidoglycan/LPS O-acetylase OafA/YrhL
MSATRLGEAATPGTTTSGRSRVRRLDLDRAKGFAILLVVFGHIVAAGPPAGVEWYDQVRYAIYRFHMPFFLYLSGTVVYVTGALNTPPGGLGQLAVRRAQRLLVPFFLFGLLILVGKLVAQHVVHVDNQPEGFLNGLEDLFVTTERSPATSVWYLWVLFVCSVLAPPIWRLAGPWGLVAAGLALMALEPPPVIYFDRLARHAVFFALGVLVAARQDALLPLFLRYQPLWWAAFAASIAAAMWGWLPGDMSLLVCGIAAIPALHGLMFLKLVERQSWPLFLGQYVMVIYLFNTIAIGVVKAVLLEVGVPWTAEGFWIHAPALTLAGIALPILGKVLVLRHIPPLDRITS